MRANRRRHICLCLCALFMLPAASAQASHVPPDTAEFRDASADGRHAFFESSLGLVRRDRDGATDYYAWSLGGRVRLVSVGVHLDGSSGEYLLDAAADGPSVLFSTYTPLVKPDYSPGNSDIDIYRWANGKVTRVSTGPTVRSCAECYSRDSYSLELRQICAA